MLADVPIADVPEALSALRADDVLVEALGTLSAAVKDAELADAAANTGAILATGKSRRGGPGRNRSISSSCKTS